MAPQHGAGLYQGVGSLTNRQNYILFPVLSGIEGHRKGRHGYGPEPLKAIYHQKHEKWLLCKIFNPGGQSLEEEFINLLWKWFNFILKSIKIIKRGIVESLPSPLHFKCLVFLGHNLVMFNGILNWVWKVKLVYFLR